MRATVLWESEIGRRVHRRLREDRIIWLTTVTPDSTPQSSPVWYLWDGKTFLIYSKPDQMKIRNVVNRPKVCLHLDSDGRGGSIAIINGEATLDHAAPSAAENVEYATRYAWGFERLGQTAEGFSTTFSVAVRIVPTTLRAWKM